MNSDVQIIRGYNTGAGRGRRIETPEQLFEEFAEYNEFAKENFVKAVTRKGEEVVPLTIISFCHFLGVGKVSWDRWRTERDDLKDALGIIEDRIMDHNARGGLAGALHAGLVARDLEKHDAKRAKQAALAPPTPPTPPNMVANVWHPDMTEEQQEMLLDAGLEIPLYTQTQLNQGMPFFMPSLPDHTTEADDDE